VDSSLAPQGTPGGVVAFGAIVLRYALGHGNWQWK